MILVENLQHNSRILSRTSKDFIRYQAERVRQGREPYEENTEIIRLKELKML